MGWQPFPPHLNKLLFQIVLNPRDAFIWIFNWSQWHHFSIYSSTAPAAVATVNQYIYTDSYSYTPNRIVSSHSGILCVFPDELDSARNRFDPTRTVYDHQKSQRLEFGEIHSIIYSSVNKYVTLSQDQYIKEKDGNFIELEITVKCCAQTRETNKKEKESTTTTTAAAESSGAERYGLTVLGQEQMTLMMIYNLLLPARLRHLFPSFSLQRQRTRYLHMANN